MFTRQHYKAIAQAMREVRKTQGHIIGTLNTPTHTEQVLANMFKNDNYRFDFDRFYDACQEGLTLD